MNRRESADSAKYRTAKPGDIVHEADGMWVVSGRFANWVTVTRADGLKTKQIEVQE